MFPPKPPYRLCIYCRSLEGTDTACPYLLGGSQTAAASTAASDTPVSGLTARDAELIRKLQEQPSALCARCSGHNIPDVFRNSRPLDPVPRMLPSFGAASSSSSSSEWDAPTQGRIPLGPPSRLFLAPSCPFCRILYCVLPRRREPGRYDGGGAKAARAGSTGEPDLYLEPYRAHLRMSGWDRLPEAMGRRFAVFLGLATSAASSALVVDSALVRSPRMTGPLIALEPRCAPPDRRLCSVLPLGDVLDLSLLGRALDNCLRKHSSHCHSKGKPAELLTARMVDVVERTVVPCPQDCDYVALSYVWGGVQPSPGALENNCLPQTIEDAITVTKALGRRYVWIDALCIDQSPNPSPAQLREKIKQLDMMSTIYGCATLTIIALTGKHANAGLAGISATRLSQVQESIDGCTIFSSPQSITLEMEAATWSSRAWTFQEEMLSRRRLTFTQSQVAFTCLEHVLEERADVATLPAIESIDNPTQSTTYQLFSSASENQPSDQESLKHRLFIFSSQLRDYTGRVMTNEGDSLNAFRGLLTSLRETLFSEGFIHGLPLQSHISTLAWAHSRHIVPRRREAFPSWSWTGWEGEVVIPEKLLDTADGQGAATVETDLEPQLLSCHGNVLAVEGWLVDLDIRTEPFSEVFVAGETEPLGSVREGDSRHNNTLATGTYPCLVIHRQRQKLAGRDLRKETVFLLALERINDQVRRQALLTVTMFLSQDFNQIERGRASVRLT